MNATRYITELFLTKPQGYPLDMLTDSDQNVAKTNKRQSSFFNYFMTFYNNSFMYKT